MHLRHPVSNQITSHNTPLQFSHMIHALPKNHIFDIFQKDLNQVCLGQPPRSSTANHILLLHITSLNP